MLSDKLFYDTDMYHNRFLVLCEPLKQYLKINNAAYININKDSNLIYVHSNPEWMQGYIKGEYYKQDPHLVHPDNIGEGFGLLLINDNYTYQPYNEIMLYAEENKFDYGFTYVTKTDVGFTAFCFTAGSKRDIINTVINQSKIIKSFIQNLHVEITSSFATLLENRSHLIELKGNLFFQQQGIIPCA